MRRHAANRTDEASTEIETSVVLSFTRCFFARSSS